MTRTLARLAAAPLMLALAACETGPADPFADPVGRDVPAFGLAVRSNEVVMRGGAPLVTMQSRFAAEVPSLVLFPFDSAALDAAARFSLDRQAAWMRRFPELGFAVYGHADEIGPGAYNEALGRRRAEAVVAYLGARGVDRGRLRALVSYGERRPLVPDAGREALNRRALTQVSGFLSRHPTVLDGRYAEVVYREYVASAAPQPQMDGIETSAE